VWEQAGRPHVALTLRFQAVPRSSNVLRAVMSTVNSIVHQLVGQHFGPTGHDPRLSWLHTPASTCFDSARSALVIETSANTDFWQRTHYGFRFDNGHFLRLPVQGDFILTTHLLFQPVYQYDQAGLMVRADANSWIKTSVEHEAKGAPQLGVVVTNDGYSDWSMQDFTGGPLEVTLRLERRGLDVSVSHHCSREECWKALRICHWAPPPGTAITAGLYACSPKGTGFKASFLSLELVL
jgi:uncharacterized protein